jgi:polyhydroxybutyrate depolymerase
MNTKSMLLSALLTILFAHTSTAQQQINSTLLHDGNTREYTVYIPASYQGTSPVPLQFSFHGGSDDIASQIALADMRPIADTAGFILVYPQAWPDPNDGGSNNWTHKPPTTHDDIYFVEAMIDALSTDYMIDNSRVYACGYSNGGEFAFELACRLSNRIAAIGVVARSMFIDTYNQCSPSHPTAVLTIHGTNDDYNGIMFGGTTFYLPLDTINSYWSNFNDTDPTPTVAQLPDINNSDGSTVEHYSWNNGDGCVSVQHFKVIGGDHDWPGSSGNMDIDATLEIWNFVSKYDINGLIGCGITSVQELNNPANEIDIYPNPAMGFVTVDMELNENIEFQIHSVIGKLIKRGKIDPQNKTIYLSDLPQNIYFLKIGNRTLKLLKSK